MNNANVQSLFIGMSLLWFDDFHRDEITGKSGLLPTPMMWRAVFSCDRN
jgi:hypothetical protein